MGSPRARVKLLVIGSIHGNETAGRAIAARLLRARPPRGTALWVITDLNPDGHAAGTRHNANGVDLNRNFPYRWQAGRRALRHLPLRLRGRCPSPSRPRSRASSSACARGSRSGTTRRCGSWCARRAIRRSSGSTRRAPGCRAGACRPTTAPPPAGRTTRFPGDTAFVVELPAGTPLAQLRGPARAAPPWRWPGRWRPQRVVARPIPFGDDPPPRDARLRAAPLRPRRLPAQATARDRGALHRHLHVRARVQHVRRRHPRRGARRAARRVRPLRDRPRRHRLPARAHHDHVPAHRRAQLDRDRHRARGHERRAGARQPRASYGPRCG